MGSQRVGHGWTTEVNWTEVNGKLAKKLSIYFQNNMFIHKSFILFVHLIEKISYKLL